MLILQHTWWWIIPEFHSHTCAVIGSLGLSHGGEKFIFEEKQKHIYHEDRLGSWKRNYSCPLISSGSGSRNPQLYQNPRMLKSCIENYVGFVYQLSPSSCILWIISRLFRIPVCVCVLVAQLCLTLCNPMDCGLPGSSIHGILQAKMLESVAVFFSREGIFLTQSIWTTYCELNSLFKTS